MIVRLEEVIRAKVFWRNTKESIKDEYKVPAIVEVLPPLYQTCK